MRFFRRPDVAQWPAAPPTHAKAPAATAARETTLEDFEYLLELCRSLSRRCLEGVSLITNDAVLEETRKAMRQGEQTNTLTFLAFFYLPLTLTTGLFGMNFQEFGQGSLSVWIGALVGLGLLVVQAAVYCFLPHVSKMWDTVRERWFGES